MMPINYSSVVVPPTSRSGYHAREWCTRYLWFRDHDPWWATLLRAVTLIALVVLFAFKGMHKVPSGSKALRTRFNKVIHYRRDVYDRLGYTTHRRGEARVVGPGLVIGIPFVHNVMIESVTEQFEPLPPMVRLQPLREFASQINFQVVDLEKALVGVTDYKGSLVNGCAAVVRPSSSRQPSAMMTSQLACLPTNRRRSGRVNTASNSWSSMCRPPT